MNDQTVPPLADVLAERGYTFRQHLEEAPWGERKLTVVDLDADQREALEQRGIDGLDEAMQRQGRWTFPAYDIRMPLPRSADILLGQGDRPMTTLVASADAFDQAVAAALADAIDAQHGIRLPVVCDVDADLALLDGGHLFVIGGSDRNDLARRLALHTRTACLDGIVPGDDGWAVMTHTGLNAAGHNVVQLAVAPAHRDAGVQYILDRVRQDGDRVELPHVHVVHQGQAMRAHLPDWETYAAGLPRQIPQLGADAPQGPADPAALAEMLGVGFDSGGFEKNLPNIAPFEIALSAARYYQLTADRRALELFRGLLFAAADYYLKTPGGASYPSDLDFRLGMVILYYSRLEHHPVFTDTDRLILTNLLLALARSVYEYAQARWPVDPKRSMVHNHETFPALTAHDAANYFSRFEIPDVQAWREYAHGMFGKPIWTRSKQRENANWYELLTFSHMAAYELSQGLPLTGDARQCLEQLIHRHVTTADNFLRAADYGDSSVFMNPVDVGLARVLRAQGGSALSRWFGDAGFARRPDLLPAFRHEYHPGLRLPAVEPPPAGDWELAPMDEAFRRDYAPDVSGEYAFDKLAFRTGWSDEDQYVLLEGVGNAAVSHSHLEVNGIVRLNHLGRHWIVSNGYGRRAGQANVIQSRRSRVRGPEDHNMLVIKHGGEIVREIPAGSQLLKSGRTGGILFATAAVTDYGGVDWLRTLVVLAGRYLLVLDRMVINGSAVDAAHVEWNCLGNVSTHAGGYRIDQQGVFMDVTSDSGWRTAAEPADRSSDWQRVLSRGEYPYAQFPLTKLVYHVPAVDAGSSHCLVTLLAAHCSESAYTLSQPAADAAVIEGPHDAHRGVIDGGDMQIEVSSDRCDIRFDRAPAVPAGADASGPAAHR